MPPRSTSRALSAFAAACLTLVAGVGAASPEAAPPGPGVPVRLRIPALGLMTSIEPVGLRAGAMDRTGRLVVLELIDRFDRLRRVVTPDARSWGRDTLPEVGLG